MYVSNIRSIDVMICNQSFSSGCKSRQYSCYGKSYQFRCQTFLILYSIKDKERQSKRIQCNNIQAYKNLRFVNRANYMRITHLHHFIVNTITNHVYLCVFFTPNTINLLTFSILIIILMIIMIHLITNKDKQDFLLLANI